MIFFKSRTQNQWKSTHSQEKVHSFHVVLSRFLEKIMKSIKFFNKNRKKQNVAILEFSLCALCKKMFSDAWVDVGCGLTWKKSISESQLKVTYRIHCIETFLSGKPLIFCHKTMKIHENIPMFTWTERCDYWTDVYVLIRDHYLRFELVHVGYSKGSSEYRRAFISSDKDGGVG